MKLTIHSTTRVVMVTDDTGAHAIPGRVWEGETEDGTKVALLVTRVAVNEAADQAQFKAELEEHEPPSQEVRDAFPLRMVL